MDVEANSDTDISAAFAKDTHPSLFHSTHFLGIGIWEIMKSARLLNQFDSDHTS